MRTELIRIDPSRIDERDLARAAEAFRGGDIVGFPTETVYGLGVRADDEDALRRLVALKGRPTGKPFAYHVPDVEAVHALVGTVPPVAAKLMRRYWPGPLTLVLPGRSEEKVGLRLPGHPVARAVLRLAGIPILGTSANRAGEPPALTGDDVLAAFPDGLAVVVDSGRSDLGEASTVVEVERDGWRVVRSGFIDDEAIRDAVTRRILIVCSGNTCRSPMAAALLHRLLAQRLAIEDRDVEGAGFLIESAGTAAIPGGCASRPAVDAMRDWGIDLEDHEPRRLAREQVERAAIVLAMTREQVRQIREIAPDASAKVFLVDPRGENILDPFGATTETYRETARHLERLLVTWVDRIVAEI